MRKITIIILFFIVAVSFGQNTFKYPAYLNGGVRVNGTIIDTILMEGDSLFKFVDNDGSVRYLTTKTFVENIDYTHNTKYLNFSFGIRVGGGDTIQTIMIRDDTLFFVTKHGNYYAELASYSVEVGSPSRIYVSTSGSDSNDGRDSLHPVQTLSYAQVLASAGDTICLKRGDTFDVTNTLQVHLSGVNGSPIVFDGLMWGTGDTATITVSGDQPNSNRGFFHVYDSRYLTIQNIVFDGGGYKTAGIVIGGNYSSQGGGQQNDEHDITVQNCEIKNCGGSLDYRIAVLVRTWNNEISNIIIQNNLIHDVSSHGIAFYSGVTDYGGTPSWTKNSIVRNNIIYNVRLYIGNVGTCIAISNDIDGIIIENNQLYANSGENEHPLISVDRNEPNVNFYPKNIIIRYNYLKNDLSTNTKNLVEFFNTLKDTLAITAKIYGNIIINNSTDDGLSTQAIDINENAPGYFDGLIELYNNTIVSNTNYAIQLNVDKANSIIFKNNLIYGTRSGGGWNDVLLQIPAVGTVEHSNNLFYNADNTTYLVDYGGSGYKASNISSFEATAVASDPLFVTEFTDLHLQSGSPADGAGIAISGVTVDYDGVTYDDPPAIGAYEKK